MSETPVKAPKPKKATKVVKKATKAQLIQRVNVVLELLSGGHTRSYILQYVTKKFKVGEDMVDKYIGVATKQLMEVNAVHVDQTAAQIKSQLWDIVRNADKRSDKVSALKELARISGIGSTNVNITVEDKDELAHLTDEELMQFYGSSKK